MNEGISPPPLLTTNMFILCCDLLSIFALLEPKSSFLKLISAKMPRKRIVSRISSLLKSDSTKLFLFGSFLLWQLPCTGFTRSFLRLFTGKLCVQLSIFTFIHFSRFALRHFSRRFLPYHIEFLPNLDSPKHNFRQSFRPFLKTIPKCGNGRQCGIKEEEERELAMAKNNQQKTTPLFTFIRANRKKSRFA